MPHQLRETAHKLQSQVGSRFQAAPVTRQTTGHSMYCRANTVRRNGFWEVERFNSTKEKELSNQVSGQNRLWFYEPDIWAQCLPLAHFFIYVCLSRGNLRAHTVERTHKTTEQTCGWRRTPELSLPATQAWPLQKLSPWQIRHKEKLLKIPACWFRAAQYKQTLQSELIEWTMEDLWNVLPQQKPLRKTRITVVFALLWHVTRLSWASACSAPCPFQRELSV